MPLSAHSKSRTFSLLGLIATDADRGGPYLVDLSGEDCSADCHAWLSVLESPDGNPVTENAPESNIRIVTFSGDHRAGSRFVAKPIDLDPDLLHDGRLEAQGSFLLAAGGSETFVALVLKDLAAVETEDCKGKAFRLSFAPPPARASDLPRLVDLPDAELLPESWLETPCRVKDTWPVRVTSAAAALAVRNPNATASPLLGLVQLALNLQGSCLPSADDWLPSARGRRISARLSDRDHFDLPLFDDPWVTADGEPRQAAAFLSTTRMAFLEVNPSPAQTEITDKPLRRRERRRRSRRTLCRPAMQDFGNAKLAILVSSLKTSFIGMLDGLPRALPDFMPIYQETLGALLGRADALELISPMRGSGVSRGESVPAVSLDAVGSITSVEWDLAGALIGVDIAKHGLGLTIDATIGISNGAFVMLPAISGVSTARTRIVAANSGLSAILKRIDRQLRLPDHDLGTYLFVGNIAGLEEFFSGRPHHHVVCRLRDNWAVAQCSHTVAERIKGDLRCKSFKRDSISSRLHSESATEKLFHARDVAHNSIKYWEIKRLEKIEFYCSPEPFYISDAEQDISAATHAITDSLARPIDFPAIVESAYRRGVRVFVESGPGNTFSAHISEILGARPHLALSLSNRFQDLATSTLEAGKRLQAHGIPIDEAALAHLQARC